MSEITQTLNVLDALIDFTLTNGSINSEELTIIKELMAEGYTCDQAMSQVILARM